MSHAHAKTIIHILLFTISSLYSSQIWGMIPILEMLSSAKKARFEKALQARSEKALSEQTQSDKHSAQQASPTNNSGQQTPTSPTPPTTHNSSISAPWTPSLRAKPLGKTSSLLEQCIGQPISPSLTPHPTPMFTPIAGIIEYTFKKPLRKELVLVEYPFRWSKPLRIGELVLVKKNEEPIYGLVQEIHDNGKASVIVDYKVYGLMQRIDPTASKAASRVANYAKECIKNISQTEITRFSPPQILKHKKILFRTKKDDNDIQSEEDNDESSEEDDDSFQLLEEKK